MKKIKTKLPKNKSVNLKKRKSKKIFNNYDNTSSSFIVWTIYIFRICLIFLLVIYPIIIALTSVFDAGVKNFIFYICAYLPDWFVKFLSFGDSRENYDSIERFLPFLIWIFMGIIFLFFILIPFFKYKTKGSKGFLGFLFLIYSILTIGFIYFYKYFLVDALPHNDVSNMDPTNKDYASMYLMISKSEFSPKSFWMVSTQIFGVFLFLCSIWCFVESILMRKNLLDYADLLARFDNKNSLVNYVLKGKMEFGSVSENDLKLSIPKLKRRIESIDEDSSISFQSIQESNLEKETKKRKRKQKKKLDKKIKEAI